MECRFCLDEGTLTCKINPLLQPCLCKGTVAYVHKDCLSKWRITAIRPDQDILCPLCNSIYQLHIIGIFLREIVPEYKGISNMLLYPTAILICWNYMFFFSSGLAYRYLDKFDTSNLAVFYTASHFLLSFLYFGVYCMHASRVVDKGRYLKTIRRYALLPVIHGALLGLMPRIHVFVGLPLHFVLPLYLIKHQETLRIMNAHL